MADALVSAALETVLGILSSAVLEEIGLLWGLKDEINSLESIFGTIQLVLQDAEVKQRKSEAIYNWLRKLKDAACDAENILDRIATEGLRRRLNAERGMPYQVKSFLSLRNPLLFRLNMVHKVKNIREKLGAIAEERHKFHLGEGVMENRFGGTVDSRQTISLVDESEIYGRQEEKEVIMEKLIDGTCDQDDLSVYAIQGMGGLGKTTLAQMVYNDERTERHFQLRIWVCVSDDFSVQRIVRAILESIEGGGSNISELDPLQHRLQERLRGIRFLLVLDRIATEGLRRRLNAERGMPYQVKSFLSLRNPEINNRSQTLRAKSNSHLPNNIFHCDSLGSPNMGQLLYETALDVPKIPSCKFSYTDFILEASGGNWRRMYVVKSEINNSETVRAESHSHQQSNSRFFRLVRLVVNVKLWVDRAKKRVLALEGLRVHKKQKIVRDLNLLADTASEVG